MGSPKMRRSLIRRRNTRPFDTAREKDLEHEPFRRGCLSPQNRDLAGPVAARSESRQQEVSGRATAHCRRNQQERARDHSDNRSGKDPHLKSDCGTVASLGHGVQRVSLG